MRNFVVRDLGRMPFDAAFSLQQELVSQRKAGAIADQLLLVEHPHVITMGRNGHRENMLASEELLARAGVAFHLTDRGGDVTYHGPGQIVAYPIFDLKEWKRDVVAYVRALEELVIHTLADFGIAGDRVPGCTGVWVQSPHRPGRHRAMQETCTVQVDPARCAGEFPESAKVCAIGVHLSRWVTSHGLALNVNTDLDYFRYIIPCGLTKPVTSMRQLGSMATREQVSARLVEHFASVFEAASEVEQDERLETIA